MWRYHQWIIFQYTSAGTDTTRMTLAWIWYYLAAFPEVQEKAQREVDENIGNLPLRSHSK